MIFTIVSSRFTQFNTEDRIFFIGFVVNYLNRYFLPENKKEGFKFNFKIKVKFNLKEV